MTNGFPIHLTAKLNIISQNYLSWGNISFFQSFFLLQVFLSILLFFSCLPYQISTNVKSWRNIQTLGNMEAKYSMTQASWRWRLKKAKVCIKGIQKRQDRISSGDFWNVVNMLVLRLYNPLIGKGWGSWSMFTLAEAESGSAHQNKMGGKEA